MKLSVVIPAHNEAECVTSTIEKLVGVLERERIEHEIVIVNDNSRDATAARLAELAARFPSVRPVDNPPPNGFGFAVRRGLDTFTGDAVIIFMADASDDPEDVVRFWRALEQGGVDCVFGTRWSRGGRVYGYPRFKYVINRLANLFIRLVLQVGYDDTTNAFKLYRAEVIRGCQPLLSHHFNLTVELPLKAVIRGYTFTVLPNSWTNRKTGVSKLKLQEMGSRYLFIVLYCLIEKWLSRHDYHRSQRPPPPPAPSR